MSGRTGRVVGLALAQTATAVLVLLMPDIVPVSLLFVWVLAAALLTGPSGALGLSVSAGALSLVTGIAGEELGLPSWWLRLGAWLLASLAVVALARSRDTTVARLQELATTDPLTGLANRRLLQERLDAQLALRDRPGAFAVLYLDLDGFKGVNDTLGHAAGDQVLLEVAARLRTCSRAGDTVARVGGDEFVLAAPGAVDATSTNDLCERISAVLAPPFTAGGTTVRVGCTIGAVLVPAGMRPSVPDLLDAADRILIALKRHSPGTHRVLSLADE